MGLLTKEMYDAAKSRQGAMTDGQLNLEIYCKRLHQRNSKPRLFNIYTQLQQLVMELRPFVEKEINEINRRAARREKRQMK
ncbi:MAG: hypothetical protein K2M34_02390 [Alphaproteobacteria bacterium]|nr:hypothetical protein [Alphaproteobacteria bacterium]